MTRQCLIAFLDVALSLLVVFILLVANMTIEAKQADEQARTPGQVMILAVWDADRDCDVDLWVRAPGDYAVGYSRKNGRVFDLLRDDLGHVSDPVPENFETAFSRGAPAGEWIVNLHGYRLDGLGPITVHVIAQVMRGGRAETLWEADVVIDGPREVTVKRFTLDDRGVMTATSTLPIALRNAAP